MYGTQPRWKKYAKRLLQRSPDARFDEVEEKLTELTQQAWALQRSANAELASSRCSPGPKQSSSLCHLGAARPWLVVMHRLRTFEGY